MATREESLQAIKSLVQSSWRHAIACERNRSAKSLCAAERKAIVKVFRLLTADKPTESEVDRIYDL